MDRLCKLRLSFNRLQSFDASPFPDIRILYLDDNQIQRIIGVACISRLDSFSLRDQGRQKV
jgi:Leucine-rich repeat (LRR) protein